MGLQTSVHETPLTESATAQLQYETEDWAFSADALEGKPNSLELTYKPQGVSARARSVTYPLTHLGVELEINHSKNTVDCDVR